jgi:hypothetical protein
MMWYPNLRMLVPVISMSIDEFNARLLEVKYVKPQKLLNSESGLDDEISRNRQHEDYFGYDILFDQG